MNCNGTRTKPFCPRDAEFLAFERRDGHIEPVKVCPACLPGVIVGRSEWGVQRLKKIGGK